MGKCFKIYWNYKAKLKQTQYWWSFGGHDDFQKCPEWPDLHPRWLSLVGISSCRHLQISLFMSGKWYRLTWASSFFLFYKLQSFLSLDFNNSVKRLTNLYTDSSSKRTDTCYTGKCCSLMWYWPKKRILTDVNQRSIYDFLGQY